MKNNKFVLSFILSILFKFSAFADSSWTVAPSIGASSFKLKSESFELGAKGGITAGAQVYKKVNPDLDIETGLNYIQSGGEQSNWIFTQEVQLDYLAIPVGARYKIYNYGANQEQFLYFKGGVLVSYLMSAQFDQTVHMSSFDVEEEDVTVSQNVKDQFNKYDLLAYAGLGGTYSLATNQNLMYELNYLRGTQKVLKDEKSHSEGITLNLMYSIQI